MSSHAEFGFYCVDRFGDKHIHSKIEAQGNGHGKDDIRQNNV